MRADLKELADFIVRSVRGYFVERLATIDARFDEFDKRVRNIPAGEKGDAGAPGEKGDAGERGEPGEKGLDGRDADILPLEAINTAESYAAGTWAKHAGGLWFARAQTDGMTGWDCIVNGIAGVDAVAGEDLRSITLSLRCSDGQAIERAFTIPAMIYRGLWREDERYERGDSVTRNGSIWALMAEEQKGKPGEEQSGWQLAAKRGRDGKAVQATSATVAVEPAPDPAPTLPPELDADTGQVAEGDGSSEPTTASTPEPEVEEADPEPAEPAAGSQGDSDQ